MGNKLLMKGNEAMGEAAIRIGCRAYFCYPITPQSEIAEYLSRRMPEVGGVFLQGEAENAVAYMLFGAAAAGVRVFTSSSSPGISLMAEAMSYLAAAELPVVIINVMRNGPGLGGILPAQSDYFQATKGAGHGDYHFIVLAPSSVQEAVDLMASAFHIAERHRNPVLLAADGMIGQMMEPVVLPAEEGETSRFIPGHEDWATTGCGGRKPHLVKTLFLNPAEGMLHNQKLAAKYRHICETEVRYEESGTDRDMDVLLVSFGTMARICRTAMDELTRRGLKIGLFRPISLYPFPLNALRRLAPRARQVVSVEMSMGQMIEDVERAVLGQSPVRFFGKAGGIVPSPEEVIEGIWALSRE